LYKELLKPVTSSFSNFLTPSIIVFNSYSLVTPTKIYLFALYANIFANLIKSFHYVVNSKRPLIVAASSLMSGLFFNVSKKSGSLFIFAEN